MGLRKESQDKVQNFDVTKKIKVGSGGTLKKTLKDLGILIKSDVSNLGLLVTFLTVNKELLSKCLYDKNKVMIPFDFDSNSLTVRIEDFSKGIFGKMSIYTLNKDYKSYTKIDVQFDNNKGEWNKKVDNKNVSKLMNYNTIKERLMTDYNIKLKKESEMDLIKKKLRYAYVSMLDRRIEDIARDFSLSKDAYLELIGNVSRVRENEYELYKAYQYRIVTDYDKGMLLKDIYKEYNTSKEPVLRAIKEQCHLIENKDVFEEMILRSYAEGMTINEVNRYFKPIKRGFYTKDEYVNLIHTKGHELRRKGKSLPPSAKVALKLFRDGTALEHLVNKVQQHMGRDEIEDPYWRDYTRYLIGVTEGTKGKLDFNKLHHEALERISTDKEWNIKE